MGMNCYGVNVDGNGAEGVPCVWIEIWIGV